LQLAAYAALRPARDAAREAAAIHDDSARDAAFAEAQRLRAVAEVSRRGAAKQRAAQPVEPACKPETPLELLLLGPPDARGVPHFRAQVIKQCGAGKSTFCTAGTYLALAAAGTAAAGRSILLWREAERGAVLGRPDWSW